MAATDNKESKDLYERTLARYREDLEKEPEAALERYGMTLINSLNPAERVRALKAVGLEAEESVDVYNLGVQASQEENWSEAIVHFKRTVEMDPELKEAIYNLALCYEKTGHVPQAKSTWQVYLDALGEEKPDEADRVRQHMESLEG